MKEFVSIIIPAHNEEAALGSDIDLIRKTMKEANIDYELIVIDDGSTDKTAEIAKQKEAILVQHKVNKGVGAARKTGILNAKSNIVVTTDADATYPNQDIPKLLEFINEYDMVIGARIGKNAIKESIVRRIPKFLIRKLASYMSRTNIPDLNSGLRVIRKDVALKYFYLLPDSHSWESTITLAFLCNGQQVKFVPIDYYKRKGKSTFHPINDTAIARINYKTREITFLKEYKSNNSQKLVIRNKFEEKTGILKVYPNMHPDVIENFTKNNYKGLILEGSGLGHAPISIKENLPNVYDVVVHVEPIGNSEENERFGLREGDVEGYRK